MISVSLCRFVGNVGWLGMFVPSGKKNNCLRWSHNACYENCQVVPNASVRAPPLGCCQILWLSVGHQHFSCLSFGRLHPWWATRGSAHFHGGVCYESVEENHRAHGHLDSGGPECHPILIPLLFLPFCTPEGPQADVCDSCQSVHYDVFNTLMHVSFFQHWHFK